MPLMWRQLVRVLVISSVAALSAYAGLIILPPIGGTTTVFDGGPTCWPGPSSGTDAGFGIVASYSACYNFSGTYGMGQNGEWHMEVVGGNADQTLITIDLGGLYFAVGGFMNYAPGVGPPIITAIGADGTTVLESYDLSTEAPISTGFVENAGAFRGIGRSTADIRYFQISGYIGMHDITLSSDAPAPEPGSIVLTALGGAFLLWALRRKSTGPAS